MITRLAVLIVVIAILSFVGQQLADKHSKDNESFRKLFHIMHGVTLAGLAFVVPLSWLIGLEVVFFISMLATRYLVGHYSRIIKWVGYFARAYRVGRLSYGEFFFPISVILLVLLSESKWEFAASILILGLADAAAALVGKKYGKRTGYKILGQKKSLMGSAVFYVVTLIVVVAFVQLAEPAISVSLLTVLWVTFVITVAENIGVYGTDNLLIPLTAVYLLNAL
jgi:phytol kinase